MIFLRLFAKKKREREKNCDSLRKKFPSGRFLHEKKEKKGRFRSFLDRLLRVLFEGKIVIGSRGWLRVKRRGYPWGERSEGRTIISCAVIKSPLFRPR